MGPFSLSWKGLLLHLETLFSEVGGESCLQLLDNMASMPETSREHFLSAVTKISKKLAEQPAASGSSEASVEAMCEEIMNELKKPAPKLSVISGGRRTSQKAARGKILPVRPLIQ